MNIYFTQQSNFILFLTVKHSYPSNKNICEHLIANYRNIIIYCNSQKEGKAINTIMNTMQKGCDQFHRIKKRFYKQSIFYDKWNEFINNEKYKKYLTYDNRWLNKLNQIKSYIDINNKKPSQIDEDIKISSLGSWLSTQLQNYSKKKCIMKNSNIRNKWDEFIEKYKIYLLTNEDIWFNNLSQVITYIDINNKRPSSEDKNDQNKALGQWILHQISKYKNKEQNMSNEIIYNRWTEFINDNKYKKYFQSNKDIWFNNISQVITYIDINNKRPSSEDKNDQNKALGQWILHQISKYKNKEQNMSNEIIYNRWTEFINDNKYKKYFQSNEDMWTDNFNNLKKFIDDNNNIPSYKNNKIIYKWLSHQKLNYKNKTDIMQDDNIYNKWTNLINSLEYKKYFQSYENKWIETFNQLKIYINTYNKTPSQVNKDNEIKKLGSWICTQKRNYNTKTDIMKNKEIYDKWTEFINDLKYKKYFTIDKKTDDIGLIFFKLLTNLIIY